jgi:hypothetical protein
MKSKKREFKGKILPFILTNLIIILGSWLSIALETNFLVYLLISFLPASIYLLSLVHMARGKIILISLFWGSIASQILDSTAHISKAYTVASTFPFRLGETPVECYIWGILFGVLVLAGYEYFFDQSSTRKLNKNHRVLTVILLTLFAGFVAVYISLPQRLNISYFYLLYTAIVILLDFVFFVKARKLFTLALLYSLLFFPIYLIHEITSLKLGYWVFHFENLVGGVALFGYNIPIEEILFFIISPILLIACYEVFADNKKAIK